jgi:hypothetical protein
MRSAFLALHETVCMAGAAAAKISFVSLERAGAYDLHGVVVGF